MAPKIAWTSKQPYAMKASKIDQSFAINMAEITIKYGFGGISCLNFRENIVKNEANLLAEGCISNIKKKHEDSRTQTLDRLGKEKFLVCQRREYPHSLLNI